MKYTAALVGMEFLMQPIRRAAVVEEVNDNQLPMEPLHYPAVAIGAEELTPMATGRSVRRMGHSQPGAMMNHKHLSNLLIRLIQKLQAGLEVNDDANSASNSGNRLVGLLAPKKRKEMGCPTTSWEKAPYEGLSKWTRFCSICRKQGHKRTTCPDRGDAPKPVRKPARCKSCGIEGHRRNNCHKVGDLRMTGM
ncbi:hypothetical protein VPH35_081851 [Triticum aestivum]|uniref:uncharacterized protein n=1 Tax=Triticum aestivum TaxID=4565 RepID=UPI001D009455|nr:uncharacterized protein LOC123102549 [Triticum aestivum]